MAGVTITINKEKISVPGGITVLEACRSAGIFIPTFCYEKDLTAPGSCRICVVEIKGQRNLSASCVTPVAEGMEIETESPAVVEARKTILELLIANHPLDCMTCDKSGSCSLQDYAYRYDVKGPTKFEGEKRLFPLDETNPYVFRDQNKCILCGKCVATCGAVQERRVLDFANRGFKTSVATFLNSELKESTCVYCGRCVAVCPVGAIMDKSLMGKGREWEVEKKEVTCTFCDYGCQFNLIIRKGKTIGAAPKRPGKGRPLCLKGRLALRLIHTTDELEKPMIKRDGQFVETTWEEALGIGPLYEKLNASHAKT